MIGYLNSSTGFLVSIIAGNGINFGIIYMARYLEARRVQGKTAAEAVAVAHRETWLATLAAAGAAMLSYGSLAITDFRGLQALRHHRRRGHDPLLDRDLRASCPRCSCVSERLSPMRSAPASLAHSQRAASTACGFAWLVAALPARDHDRRGVVGVASLGAHRPLLRAPIRWSTT